MDWNDKLLNIGDGWMFSDLSNQAPFPASILIPFENPDYFNPDRFHSRLVNRQSFKSLTIGTFEGKTIGILKSKFGSAAVAFAVHLLAKRGVKNIIGIGYCGGIGKRLKSGDILIPFEAHRQHCCSLAYIKEEKSVAPLSQIFNICQETVKRELLGVKFVKAFSTDAIMLEDDMLIQQLASRNIEAIDMEAAALLALGEYFQVQTLAILVVSDNPLTLAKADYKKVDISIDRAIDLALKIIETI